MGVYDEYMICNTLPEKPVPSCPFSEPSFWLMYACLWDMEARRGSSMGRVARSIMSSPGRSSGQEEEEDGDEEVEEEVEVEEEEEEEEAEEVEEVEEVDGKKVVGCVEAIMRVGYQ